MKISIYALHLSFGGVEKYVASLANMLAKEHEVEIVSTYMIDDAPAFPIDSKVKITYLLRDLKPNKTEFKECIKRKDIIGIIREGVRSVRVLFARKNANIRSLKACTSDVIISTRAFHNALIGKYSPKDAVKITGEHNHHNNDERYIAEVLGSCKGFDYFIPISKELCDYYREPMAKIGVKTEYIKFCIDANPDFEAPQFKSHDIISVGRLSPEKGPEDLINVFEGVHEKDASAKLHIVGDGSELEKIKGMAAEKGLTDSIIFYGFKDKKFIYSLLPKASLYLMTSHTESFGLVLLEAMSCGIPCLAFSSAQGAHEIIRNGENGYLIENRDINAMQEKIVSLLSDKEQLSRLSECALKTADEFSYEKTQASWLELMNNIEKEKRGNVR